MSDVKVFDPQVADAMTSLGIDHALFDDNSIELPKVEEVASSETEGESSEVVTDDNEAAPSETADQNTESEGSEEAPKEIAKEAQDYQAKIEAFEAEKKAYQDEKLAYEKEFKEKYAAKVEDYDKIDSFLTDIAQNDSEVFELVQDAYAKWLKENGINEKVSKEIASLKEEIKSFKAKASDEVTLTKLDAEVNEFKKTLGKQAEESGIKIDYKAVEDYWAKAGGSFKEAVFAKYGESLMKAAASKAKIAESVKKTAAIPKVATTGNLNRSTKSDGIDWSKLSRDEAALQAMRMVVG
jgi:hypothetical protein